MSPLTTIQKSLLALALALALAPSGCASWDNMTITFTFDPFSCLVEDALHCETPEEKHIRKDTEALRQGRPLTYHHDEKHLRRHKAEKELYDFYLNRESNCR